MPPFTTVGSMPPASKSAATIEVVVVLPCVPATATFDFSRISSASISARRTTGSFCARAASSSGLPGLIADEITTTLAPSRFSAFCPTNTVAPFAASRSVIGLAFASDPCTENPWFSSTSAIPDMPMPPMPTKWMAPMSCGSRVSPFMSSLSRPASRPAPPDARPRRAARPPARRRHRPRPLRVGEDGGDGAGQPLGRQFVLAEHERAAGLDEARRVRRLMVVGRVRVGHEDRRPPDRRDVGDRARARAADHEARLGQPLRHVLEEAAQVGRHAQILVGRPHPVHVLGPHLLREPQPCPQARIEMPHRLGHDPPEEPRPLAAADHHQPHRPVAGLDIGSVELRQHRGPHRVADVQAPRPRRQRRRPGAAGDDLDPRREAPVDPPEHPVLLVDQPRDLRAPPPPASPAAPDSRRSRRPPTAGRGASPSASRRCRRRSRTAPPPARSPSPARRSPPPSPGAPPRPGSRRRSGRRGRRSSSVTRQPCDSISSASACAGNMCPPVPPAAMTRCGAFSGRVLPICR